MLFVYSRKETRTKKLKKKKNPTYLPILFFGACYPYVYLLIFVFTNPRNIAIPGIYIKVTSFITYPNFWDKV